MIIVGCLKACKKTVGGREVVYCLLLVRSKTGKYYAIKVSVEGESKLCRFGTNRTKAKEVFKKIVANGVTPCTLADIAEDYAKLGV